MRLLLTAALILLAFALPCRADTFYLKLEGSDLKIGPLEFKEGTQIKFGKNVWVIANIKSRPAGLKAAGDVDITIANDGDQELTVTVGGEKRTMMTLKPKESRKLELPIGSVGYYGGTYVDGRLKEGTQAVVGAAYVTEAQVWTFRLNKIEGRSLWIVDRRRAPPEK